ncbi:hypothetical protein ACFLRC_03625 [Candidatus Altiarchaeota archaeon]
MKIGWLYIAFLVILTGCIGQTKVQQGLETTTLSLSYTESEIEEAIEYGKQHKGPDDLNFTLPWKYPPHSTFEDHLIIYTPYLKIARDSQEKARLYKLVDREEIGQFLDSDKWAIVLMAFGDSYGFAQDYHMVVLYEGEVIQPTNAETWLGERLTQLRGTKYVAANMYEFPGFSRVKGKTVTVKVVKSGGEEDTYTVGLQSMK